MVGVAEMTIVAWAASQVGQVLALAFTISPDE
jgi:hypothetical protein